MTMGLLVVVFVLLLSSAAKSLDIRRRLNVHLPGVTPHSYEIGETVSASRPHAHTFSMVKGGEEGHHQVHKQEFRISKILTLHLPYTFQTFPPLGRFVGEQSYFSEDPDAL